MTDWTATWPVENLDIPLPAPRTEIEEAARDGEWELNYQCASIDAREAVERWDGWAALRGFNTAAAVEPNAHGFSRVYDNAKSHAVTINGVTIPNGSVRIYMNVIAYGDVAAD